MIDLFYECTKNNISNYAENKILYSCATTHTFPLLFLNVFNWFGNNNVKANPSKCQVLLSTKSLEVVSMNGIQITSRTAETLLDITIDSELNFENHHLPYVAKWTEKLMLLEELPIICPYKNADLWWKHLLNLSLTIFLF